jgi:COMPASS component SWD2
MPSAIPLTSALFSTFQVQKVFKDSSRQITSMDWDDEGKLLLACPKDEELMRIYNTTTGSWSANAYSKKYGCDHGIFTHRSNNLIYASTKNDDAIRYSGIC